MFQRFMTLFALLVLSACSSDKNEQKSKSDFESVFEVSHSYELVNPYAKDVDDIRLIVDLPLSDETHQMLFDVKMPKGSKVFERENGEQYLEVSLGEVPAKQKTSIKIAYSLGQNSRSNLPLNSSYGSLFKGIENVIEFPEGSEITLDNVKVKVVENWLALSELLPLELKDNEIELDLIKNIVAADIFLVLKGAGAILSGFACESTSHCIAKESSLWVEYMDGQIIHSSFLTELPSSHRKISVKRVTQSEHIIDFLKNRIGVDGVGILVSLN